MKSLTEDITNKLRELKTKFLSQLPEREKEIMQEWEYLQKNTADIERFTHLRLLIHRLAGTGSSFGCYSLSIYGKKIVTIIDKILAAKGDIDEETVKLLKEHMAEMFRCMDEGTDIGSDDIKPANVSASGIIDKKNISFFVDEYREIAKDFKNQLGFYGYNVTINTDFQEVKKAINTFCRILIIEAGILAKNPDLAKTLLELKTANEGTVNYIFIANDDDFDIRLQCVRSGGDDFFLLPLDLSRLIDRIDAITTINDTEPYHILIVDDDPEQVSYYALILQQAGMITSVASDPKRVIHILVEAKPELILMDMYMQGCSGSELAAVIRQQEAFVGVPIVFLSFETDKEKQLAAIQHGGDDFLTKPIKPEHLISAVTTRAERTRSLRFFMERDSLTGLLNHTNLKEQLNREIMRAQRTGTSLCFAMIDLDHFKNVNDSYGHITGDRVLKSLSRLLLDRLRRTDIIGRYGGEEFGVILLNTEKQNAFMVMDEIRKNFSQIRHHSGNQDFHVTLSCGIAAYPEINDPGEIATIADKCLYAAKESGRNKVILAEKE